MEGMPDVVSIWGQPSFLDEVLDAGVMEPLNEEDYQDYGFIKRFDIDEWQKKVYTNREMYE